MNPTPPPAARDVDLEEELEQLAEDLELVRAQLLDLLRRLRSDARA